MADNYFLARARTIQGRLVKRYGRVHDEWYEQPDTTPSDPLLPGQWLACCAQWQPITTVPHVCPSCGQRYLEATEVRQAPGAGV